MISTPRTGPKRRIMTDLLYFRNPRSFCIGLQRILCPFLTQARGYITFRDRRHISTFPVQAQSPYSPKKLTFTDNANSDDYESNSSIFPAASGCMSCIAISYPRLARDAVWPARHKKSFSKATAEIFTSVTPGRILLRSSVGNPRKSVKGSPSFIDTYFWGISSLKYPESGEAKSS
jgi:hypothetical protein